MKKVTIKLLSIVIILCLVAGISMANDLGLSIPIGGGFDEDQLEICPEGAMVVTQFLRAWAVEDYKTMYELIDDTSKEGYPYEEARFDFQFMEYKQYEISAIRKQGEDYEFFLSFGSWQTGDKELTKITIDGESYKIKMASRNSVFKKSADSYF